MFDQLLTHRSSIRDDGPAYDRTYVCGDSPVALPKWLKEYFTPGGVYWDETNWHGWTPRTANPPAEPPNYSNVGFGMLGYLVELLSQKPFPTVCKQRIFGPLGMRHTGWLLRDIDVTRHATPYLKVPDPITPEEVVFYQILVPPGTDLKSVPPGTLVPLRLYGWARRGAGEQSRRAFDPIEDGQDQRPSVASEKTVMPAFVHRPIRCHPQELREFVWPGRFVTPATRFVGLYGVK